MDASTCDPRTHRPHGLHGPGSVWPEINCAVDGWIELLALTGREPAAVAGIALAADVWGDHWEMVQFDTTDLERVLGVRRREMTPWRPVTEHIADQLARGGMLSVEVDAWWLPDTEGTSYRREHVKTSIVPLTLDDHSTTYLHNDGMYVAEGDDLAGLFSSDPALTQVPHPYIEVIAFDPPPADVPDRALAAARHHLSRRPGDNPVRRLQAVIEDCVPAVVTADSGRLHAFAFSSVRQLGGTGQLAAGHLRWLADALDLDPEPAGHAARAFDDLARSALSAQFQLARAVTRGRPVPAGLLGSAAEAYDRAMAASDRLLA